ncbi:TolC family protein [Mucilaginibacter rubeus]|uniref:TolC family protein n=1 Tax=Mucilaginibacter rubeus TaxID=2027860 RepID=A0AAE6JJA4_9SPHI|nr:MULTISPECIES: TolC family protein [Mucilaginibacter]QEM06458.1 TolC family protein [Mucilaginibacter rubeus]QEM19044.1 TolC family protein [Mucilaginibacter gossypii]QTE44415.1 TolC family protein [Mucilaginibacter rubeus]QTE51014.1 TolC family protein [Mucilaginibacter rubeus]QTE56097.1 TolC family protein [Mucilaginibacter rubeus]
MRKLCLLLTLIPVLAMAQSNPPQKFTLQSALDYAKINYPFIKAKQAQKSKAEYELKSSKADYLPNLSVQDQYLYSTNNSVTGSFFPNDGLGIPVSGGIRAVNDYQGVWDSFSTLFVNWNIFNFGRVKAQVKNARQKVDQAELDLENEVFKHQVTVADSYLLYIISEKLTALQQKNLDRAKVVHDAVIAAVSSGLRPGADSSFVEAELSKAKLLLLQSKETESEQKSRLASLLGLNNENFEVDTASYNQVVPKQLQNPEVSIDTHPQIKLYQSNLLIDKSRGQIIRRSVLPSVSFLGGGWARGSGIDNATNAASTSFSKGVGYQVYNYMVGVSMKWSITGLLKGGRDYKANEQQYFSDKYLLDDQKLKLNESLRTARMKEELALEQAKQAPVQLNSAVEAYQEAYARYQSGLSTLPEYYQAFYLLNRAEIDQSYANNKVWRALLLNAASTGDLNIFTSQLNNQ